MNHEKRIVHVLDDLAMGGVTRALDNFFDPALSTCGDHEVFDIRTLMPRARARSDIAVIHFTANWRKLLRLLCLKHYGNFDRVILVEHTYTRGYELARVPNTKRFRRMLRTAYALVDTIVAVSKDQQDWIISNELAPADKVVVIPQSRDTAELMTVPAATRSKGPLRIGAFGRFHEQKGFDLLIEAMAMIPEETAELHLAGAGDDAAYLKALAMQLPNVRILSRFESPRDFLASVDIVAIPSRWEAFGLVGTEARAAGRPLIAADIDGLKDQIGHHSFSHRVEDVEDIRRAVLEAAGAQDLNRRAKAARTHVSGEFTDLQTAWKLLLTAQLPPKTALV